MRVFEANYRCYGVRKVWHQLRREGRAVARCTVARLMRQLGLAGLVRGKARRTTIADAEATRPADLVQRDFRAPAPNPAVGSGARPMSEPGRIGSTYKFVIDVYSGQIVGWQLATHLRTDLALDAFGDGDLATPARAGRSVAVDPSLGLCRGLG